MQEVTELNLSDFKSTEFDRTRFGTKEYAGPYEQQYVYEIQERAKDALARNGKLMPLPGNESVLDYRRRIVEKLKNNTALAKTDISRVPEKEFDSVEQKVYTEALKNAERPLDLKPGELRKVTFYDKSRAATVTEFRGLSVEPWLNDFKAPALVSPICNPYTREPLKPHEREIKPV